MVICFPVLAGSGVDTVWRARALRFQAQPLDFREELKAKAKANFPGNAVCLRVCEREREKEAEPEMLSPDKCAAGRSSSDSREDLKGARTGARASGQWN